MAYVIENKKFNTTFGKIKNNNTAKQIQRQNIALFQFSISEVTVDDGTLTVVCDTITGDSVTYTCDLDKDAPSLTAELSNYSTGGNIELFRALVWELYRSTLNTDGEQEDATSLEQLRDTITSLQTQVTTLTGEKEELTTANGTLSGQVETLTGEKAELTTANNTLSGQVDTLTARVAELEAQVAALTPPENNNSEPEQQEPE